MNAGFWHKVPVVRLFIPFALGVGIAMFFSIPFWLICLLVLFTLSGCVFYYYHNPELKRAWLPSAFAMCCMFACGILLHHMQDVRIRHNYFTHIDQPKWVVIKIDEPAVAKKKSWKARSEIIAVIDNNDVVHQTTGKAIIYIQKTDSVSPVNYADRIILPINSLKEIAPPQNPGEFNYKRYLAFHHCYHQAYLRHGKYYFAGNDSSPDIYKYVYATQAYFKQVLTTYVRSKNEMGIAQALLYGHDEDIDEETVQAFANTGTLHVLAVSGMHVGIIFMILNMLLKSLDRNRYLKWLKAFIALMVLWAYSLLCGMSPSILRATVMFSFIILSQTINRPANIYNTLAASAFLLMLFDCNIIANVGFQLSYMAVLGIVFLQPYIYRMFIVHSWLADQIWKITSVSIAAQISTSPIGLLYFHQFPNVFLFSNLCIIPLTTIILYSCLLLMAVSPIHILATLIGYLVYYIILFTNTLVRWVEQIPYAYVEGVQISIVQTILLYAITGALVTYLLKYDTLWLKTSLILCIVFAGIVSARNYQQTVQNEITVYNISNHAAIRITQGKNSIILADSTLYFDKEKKRFHLQQHIWNSGIKNETFIPTDTLHRLIRFNDSKIFIAGNSKVPERIKDSIDWMICNSNMPVKKLILLPVRNFILTPAVSYKHANTMARQLDSAKRNVVNVRETGAFQLSLQHGTNRLDTLSNSR